MDKLTPGQLVAALAGLILAAAGAVVTIGNALEKIAKAWRAAKAPNDEQNHRLDDLEAWRKEVDAKLNSDKAQLDAIQAGLRASYQAQLALLDHGIDGNNIEQMQHAKEALQMHLINRKE